MFKTSATYIYFIHSSTLFIYSSGINDTKIKIFKWNCFCSKVQRIIISIRTSKYKVIAHAKPGKRRSKDCRTRSNISCVLVMSAKATTIHSLRSSSVFSASDKRSFSTVCFPLFSPGSFSFGCLFFDFHQLNVVCDPMFYFHFSSSCCPIFEFLD